MVSFLRKSVLQKVLSGFQASLIEWCTNTLPKLIAKELAEVLLQYKAEKLDGYTKQLEQQVADAKVAVFSHSPYIEMLVPLVRGYVQERSSRYPQLTAIYHKYGSLYEVFKRLSPSDVETIEETIAIAITDAMERASDKLRDQGEG